MTKLGKVNRKSTRKAYGEFLTEVGANEDIVVLDADLSAATKTDMFAALYPNRHINVGIAEQDLVGTACGLSLGGKKVFASSFAMFLSGRAFEQIRNTAAYSNVDVNFVATHAGVSVGEDGPTHQCIEDISIMRTIPNMKVICPCDEFATKALLKKCLEEKGPKYVRLARIDVKSVYNSRSKFEFGKSTVFGDGKDGTIFAVGSTVQMALDAKEILKKKDINVRVVDLYSIKPIDRETIINCAKETKKLVSIEDHNIIGGIASAISEVLCEEYPKKLIKIAINDTFGKSGKYEDVYEKFGITVENIVSKFK